MDKIMSFVNDLSLEKYMPKLDNVLDRMQWLIEWAVKVGPICILALGLIYMLLPPKEANRYFGFRTYFGMGSISAWFFTQRVSGALMTIVGLSLYLIANSAVKTFGSMDIMEMSEKAIDLMKGQVISLLVIYVVMFLLTFVMFNRKGVCRFPGIKNTLIGKLIPDEPAPKKKRILVKAKAAPKAIEEAPAGEEIPEGVEVAEEAEEEAPVEYERQGEQVITVDDIVIEGLDE